MADIQLHQLGKRYNDHWLFRNLSLTVSAGEKLAITGKNGSGKSTLLQIISGYIRPTEGSVNLIINDNNIPSEKWYSHLAWSAPYIDIIEELTVEEFANFYISHKKMLNGINANDLIALCRLHESSQKPIRSFSSGMKQRLKLGCAIVSDTPLLLLDEPLSNLDEDGYNLYKELINQFTANKTVLICSNDSKEETFCCTRKISVSEYL